MGKRKPRIVYVGVDVSKDKLDVAWLGLNGSLDEFQVANDEEGHAELVRRITAGRIDEARVVLEATGPYSAPVTAFLAAQKARVKVMVVQPKAAREFSRATMRRAKTDRVDARVLCEFAYRMAFVPTVLPSKDVVRMRGLSRHLAELVDRRAALKNQRHAADASGETSPALERALDREEEALSQIIVELEAEVLEEIERLVDAKRMRARMQELPGIKDRTVARLLPELLALPRHLTPKEAVAFAGLDPRPNQSGSSRNGQSWRISKQGNPRIRRSLYLSSLVAVRYFPPARELYERLRAAGKPKKVAIVATMRKLLTALWAMLARDEAFDHIKFAGRKRRAA
jgi:transposase